MKISKYTFLALIAVLTGLSSCGKEDDLMDSLDKMTTLAIDVSIEDFQTSAPVTRASDNEFKTTFSTNDMIGIYAIDNGTVISKNVPYKWTGSSWDAQDQSSIYAKENDANVTYFAYYPYREAMDNKDVKSVNDLIQEFEVSSIQNTHELYTQNDLIVGTGTLSVDTRTLLFNLSHKLSLIVVDLKGERTHYYSDGYELYTKITSIDKITIGNVTSPFNYSGGNYRALVKPSASVSLDISYKSNNKTITYNKNVNGVEGKYTRMMIYGGGVSSQTTINIGDFFYSDGHISTTLDNNKTCIGVVFSLPNAEKNYNGKRLVVALTNAGTAVATAIPSLVNEYSAKCPAPATSLGWEVMGFELMRFLAYGYVPAFAIEDEMTMKNKINSFISTAGGEELSGWYRDSSWSFNFDTGQWTYTNPTHTRKVRCILEF